MYLLATVELEAHPQFLEHRQGMRAAAVVERQTVVELQEQQQRGAAPVQLQTIPVQPGQPTVAAVVVAAATPHHIQTLTAAQAAVAW